MRTYNIKLLLAACGLSISMAAQAIPVAASEPQAAAATTLETNTAEADAGPALKYTIANLNVREGVGTNTKVIMTLSKSTPVSVISESNEWSRLSNGYYVCSRYLKDIPVWESTSIDETEYTTKTISSNYKTIKALNYSKATSLNKQKKIVDYMILNDGTHYFTVDESAHEGGVVAELKAGDLISIDGILIQIDGSKDANYKTDTNAIKIWEDVGFKTCIQTCVYPYGGAIVIKYGHIVKMEE